MKKIIANLLWVIFFNTALFAQNNLVTCKLLPNQTIFGYIQDGPLIPPRVYQKVVVTVACSLNTLSSTKTDIAINFSIAPSATGTASLLSPTIGNPIQTIPKDSFSTKEKKIQLTLYVLMQSVKTLEIPEIYSITIANQPEAKHLVFIQNKPNTRLSGNTPAIVHQTVKKLFAPYIRDANGAQLASYQLKYSVEGFLSDNITKQLVLLQNNSGNSIQPTLLTTGFTIQASKTLSGYYEDSVEVFFNINAVKNFGLDEHVYLAFKDEYAYDDLVFTRDKLEKPNKAFWVEIGSNFDFIDGLQPNNFFGGAFFHKRDIRPFSFRNFDHDHKRKRKYKNLEPDSSNPGKLIKQTVEEVYQIPKKNNLSLFAGVYESKTISTISSNRDPRIYYDPLTAKIYPGDTVGIFTDTGTTKKISVTKNISLFFSPQVRLTNGSANSDGLHLFASLWSEVQWQQASVDYDYSALGRLNDSIRKPRSQASNYLPGDKKITLDIKTHYLGLGLPIFYSDNDVNVYINPVIGWTTQPQASEIIEFANRKDDSELPRFWRPFYVFQFRLNEEKYGFAFTGEVRGLILKKSPPLISLALTKKFDLTKFLEFK